MVSDLRLKPPPGFYTFTSVRDRLADSSKTRVTSSRLRRLCDELGIKLYPFVRRETFITKTYKSQLRWLTEEEVTRIMELFHRQIEERRAKRTLERF